VKIWFYFFNYRVRRYHRQINIYSAILISGFIILATGISSIATGFKLRKTSGEWVMIYGGVLAVLLGPLLVFNPILTAALFVSLLGFFSIVGGIILIVYSLKIRKLKEV